MDLLNTKLGHELACLAESALRRSLTNTHAVSCKRIDVEQTINDLESKMTFYSSIDIDSEWVTLVFKTK